MCAKRKKLRKIQRKLIVNNRLLPSHSKIYEKIATKLKIKDTQTVYLHVERFFGVKAKEASNEEEGDEEDADPADEHIFTLNVEEDDLVQSYIEHKAYLRDIRSYFRMIIWPCSNYKCTDLNRTRLFVLVCATNAAQKLQ